MRNRYQMNSWKHGFTLIEILLVIAIVGLLSALLFPVFASVRERGRMASCASNLKQIGTAISLYAQDNNQYYPDSTGPQPFCTWLNRIDSYIKSPQVFQCPAYAEGEFRAGCPKSEDPKAFPTVGNGSYDINVISVLSRRFHFREYRFRHPTTTILVLDGDGFSVTPGFYDQPGSPSMGPVLNKEWIVTTGVDLRHTANGREGDNVLWADGHVKWLSVDAMTDRHLWRAEESDQTAEREKAGLAP